MSQQVLFQLTTRPYVIFHARRMSLLNNAVDMGDSIIGMLHHYFIDCAEQNQNMTMVQYFDRQNAACFWPHEVQLRLLCGNAHHTCLCKLISVR